VCLRVAEIDQRIIAYQSREKAAKAVDGFGHALPVPGEDFTQHLGVKPRRERRGVRQVAEHNRQLAALRDVTLVDRSARVVARLVVTRLTVGPKLRTTFSAIASAGVVGVPTSDAGYRRRSAAFGTELGRCDKLDMTL